MSYADTHRYRIGINYGALPVNKPHCPYATYHRDGQICFDDNGGDSPVYEPNSFGGPTEDNSVKEPPLKISGNADRYDHRHGNEDYSQAGDLFRLMSDNQRQQLFNNIIGAMSDVPEHIQMRQIAHFYKADPAYGEGVAKGLGIDLNKAIKAA